MDYRLYFLDQHDHIRSARDFSATDDGEAAHRARNYCLGQCVEVWQGARQVSRIEAADPDEA